MQHSKRERAPWGQLLRGLVCHPQINLCTTQCVWKSERPETETLTQLERSRQKWRNRNREIEREKETESNIYIYIYGDYARKYLHFSGPKRSPPRIRPQKKAIFRDTISCTEIGLFWLTLLPEKVPTPGDSFWFIQNVFKNPIFKGVSDNRQPII